MNIDFCTDCERPMIIYYNLGGYVYLMCPECNICEIIQIGAEKCAKKVNDLARN